jgi:hypothetical protein
VGILAYYHPFSPCEREGRVRGPSGQVSGRATLGFQKGPEVADAPPKKDIFELFLEEEEGFSFFHKEKRWRNFNSF